MVTFAFPDSPGGGAHVVASTVDVAERVSLLEAEVASGCVSDTTPMAATTQTTTIAKTAT